MIRALKQQQVFLFYVVTIFYWFSLYAYTPELTPYAEELGADYQMLGIIGGAFGIIQLFLRLPQGILSDRTNKRKIFIVAGLLVGVVAPLIPFFYPSINTIILCRLLAGITATTWIPYTILFASYFNKNESPKAMGLLNTFNYIGRMAAMLIAGVLAFSFGARYLFLLSAVAAGVGVLCSFMIKENHSLSPEPIKFKEIIEVSKDKLLIFYSVLGIISQFISFATIYGFTPIVADNTFGANSLQFGFLAFLAEFPAALISPIAGTLLIGKLGERKVLIVGYVLSTIACFVIPFLPNIYCLYSVQFIGGIGRGMVFPLLMGLCIKHVSVEKRSTAMGFYQAMYSVGVFFGPIVLGYVSNAYSLDIGFYTTGVIGLIAVIMVSLNRRLREDMT